VVAPSTANVDRVVRRIQSAEASCGTSLAALAEALAFLEDAQGRVEAGFDGLEAAAEDVQAVAESEGGQLDAAWRALAEAAEGGADGAIPGAAERVEAAHAAWSAVCEEVEGDLGARAADLEASGFGSLRSALEAVGEGDDATAVEARRVLDEAAEGCQAAGDRLASSGSQAAARFGEAGAALGGEVADSLVTASEAAIAELDAEAAATQQGASRVESEIVAAYGTWKADVEAAQEAYAEVVAAASEAAAGNLAQAVESRFYAPCQAVEADAVPAAQDALSALLAAADGWCADCGALDGAAGDLQDGHAAMARINRAIAEGA
jgi:hypothetical protein